MIILSFPCFLRYNQDIGGHYMPKKIFLLIALLILAFLIQSLFTLIKTGKFNPSIFIIYII